MNKTVIVILAVLIIAIFGYTFIAGREDVPVLEQNETVDQTDQTNGELNDGEVSGAVVSVNVDQVPVDGPALITILTQNGSQTVIAVPSMGINLCAAQANIMNYSELKAGDKVEARGQVGTGGMIIPCESANHYLRAASN